MRLIPFLTVVLLFSLFLTSPANAYIAHKKLIGGVENRTFYITNSVYNFRDPLTGYYRTIDYGSYIRLAVRNWNDAVQSENYIRNANVQFTETTDWSKATVIFDVSEYGENIGFYGQAFFTKNGSPVTTDPIDGSPTQNYDKVRIAINVSNTFAFGSTLLNLATHEFGHAIGLKHWDLAPYTVMHSYIFSTASTPQADDINGIHAIYSTN